uniref:hypothetical protein n=1 Tax=Microvirga roseola TaxID=2883126 RepID=UPI001E55A016
AVCLDRQGPGADQHGSGPDLEQLRRAEVLKESLMMGMMDGMEWTMAGMGLVWLLIAILLILGIAALVKYLRR